MEPILLDVSRVMRAVEWTPCVGHLFGGLPVLFREVDEGSGCGWFSKLESRLESLSEEFRAMLGTQDT